MMKSLMASIFGAYEPIYTETFNNDGEFIGSVIADGFAGVDWAYVGGVVLFAIALYCMLRIIEAVIRSL